MDFIIQTSVGKIECISSLEFLSRVKASMIISDRVNVPFSYGGTIKTQTLHLNDYRGWFASAMLRDTKTPFIQHVFTLEEIMRQSTLIAQNGYDDDLCLTDDGLLAHPDNFTLFEQSPSQQRLVNLNPGFSVLFTNFNPNNSITSLQEELKSRYKYKSPTEIKKVVCECGIESVGGTQHSSWCPKHNKG